MTERFTIIGGGIAGLTTAIALQKIGITATVFEAAPCYKTVGAGLGLGANAIKAFWELSMADEVVKHGRLLPAFTIYSQQGKQLTKTDSRRMSEKFGVDNFTIDRTALQSLLLSKIDSKNIHTSKQVINIERAEKSLTLTFSDKTTHQTDFLIVADGIHSAIRQLLIPGSKPRYAGYTCWRAIIDNSNFKLSETSETWGSKGRFGIVPLANNKIYWFACINAAQNDIVMKQFSTNDLLNHFKDFHGPIPDIIAATKNDALIWGDILDIEPINKYAFENILLVGDAAHATTPNLGQGACQAIEDAVILAAEISNNPDIKKAFQAFEKRRLERTHYIINNSAKIGRLAQLENRTLISIRNFILRLLPATFNEKQLEKLYTVDLKWKKS
ncbi:MAG: FAD-dependent monooxygenase [Ferruginibacter sp.]